MNDLNKLGSFLAIAQIAQLPLVFFIAVLFYKAIKVLGIKELLWVSLAFISNLFYILFTILSNKISPFYTSLLTIPYSSALSIILDLCTSLFFYIGTITWYYRKYSFLQ